MHASVVFFPPPSYLWTQPRSESDCMRLADPICVMHIQAMDVPGPSANSVPRPMRMPDFNPTSSGSRHSGSLEPHSLLLQRGPKRIRDLWTAAHLPQTATDSSQASPLLVTMSYILPEFQYYRHATECHGFWEDSVLDIITSLGRLVHTIPDDHHRMFSHHRH